MEPKNLGVVGYTNSDFVGCMDSQKSTTGYCFKFGNEQSHGSRNFRSTRTLQRPKVVLLRGQLAHTFRHDDPELAPFVYNNSQGVVAMSKNPVEHNASKHIDV